MVSRRLLFFLFTLTCVGRGTAAEVELISPQEVVVGIADTKVRLTFAVFSPQKLLVQVIDNAGSNDQGRYARLAFAMKTLDCVAGCNGAFFEQHPFTPVGGMIASGTPCGRLDRQSWM